MGAVITDTAQLTGSRYFGTADDASDFDLFFRDSLALRAMLENRGFQKLDVAIEETADVRAVYQKGNIHIQLRRDPATACKIQAAMMRLGFGTILKNKVAAAGLWRLAWACVRMGREQGNKVTPKT